MPVIPIITTQPGDVQSGGILPRIDAGAMAAPARALEQSGRQWADVSNRFALEYANFKVESESSQTTAALSRQLSELEFETSKIPDRMEATRRYDEGSQKIRDGFNQSGANYFVKAKVFDIYNRENEARRASTQKAAFRLESEKARGSATESINTTSVEAADPLTDPAKREVLIQKNNATIDGLVSSGMMTADGGAAAKIKMQSNVYASAIEIARGKDPRFGISLFEAYKNKLDLNDRTRLEKEIEDSKKDVSADNVVARDMPKLGAFGNVSHWTPHIAAASQQTGVRQSLIAGIASQESAGVAGAVSPAGAGGPMQFMPGTATSEGVKDRFDPKEAIPKGAAYYRKQLDRFGGSEVAALAAYNWGPENVDRWLKKGAAWSDLPKETQDYIQKVMAKDREFAKAAGGDTYEAWVARAREWQLGIAQNTSIPPDERARLLAKSNNIIALTGGKIEADRKQISDDADTAGLGFFNGSYQPGSAAKIAERWRNAGDNSRASMWDGIAANESAFMDFAGQPLDVQRRMSAFLPAQSRAHATAMIAETRERRKDAREAAARDEATINQSLNSDVDARSLIGSAMDVVRRYMEAGEPEKAQAFYKTFTGKAEGQFEARGRTPMETEEARRRLREMADAAGGSDPQAAARLAFFEKSAQTFATQAKNDPINSYIARTGLGPVVQFNPQLQGVELQQWVNQRAEQVRTIKGIVGPGMDDVFFTPAEMDNLTAVATKGNVQQQGFLFGAIAAAAPPEFRKAIAQQMTKKGAEGDVWADAINFFARRNPGDGDIANRLLLGAKMINHGGTTGKDQVQIPTTMPDEINTSIGLALQGLAPEDSRRMQNSIIANYVALRGSKIVEDKASPDSATLRQAIRDIAGTQMKKNGGAWLIPSRIEPYQFTDALGTMTEADVPPLQGVMGARQAEKGDIAAIIKREATFQTVGDGQYYVWMPDPQRGGTGMVVRADTGRPYVLDIRPLLNRPVLTRTSRNPNAAVPPPPTSGIAPIVPPDVPPPDSPPPAPSGADLIRQRQRDFLSGGR